MHTSFSGRKKCALSCGISWKFVTFLVVVAIDDLYFLMHLCLAKGWKLNNFLNIEGNNFTHAVSRRSHYQLFSGTFGFFLSLLTVVAIEVLSENFWKKCIVSHPRIWRNWLWRRFVFEQTNVPKPTCSNKLVSHGILSYMWFDNIWHVAWTF